MSVGGSGSGTTGVSDLYDDFEVQAVDLTASIEPNDPSTTAERVVNARVDPLEGLDREELAEIVGFEWYINTSARTSQSGANQNSDQSEVIMDFTANINDGVDFTGGPVSVTKNTTTNVASGDNDSTTAVNDGELFRINRVINAPFSDASSGVSGGGGSFGPTHVYRNYRDIMGGGPVIDRFDDLVHKYKVKTNNMAGVAKMEAKGQYFFATEERDVVGSNF